MLLRVPDKNVKYALELIEVAESDFKAAKLLMNNKLYPHALFHVEQGFEKLLKGILVAMGLTEPKDLKREIGHLVVRRGLFHIMDRLARAYVEFPKEISNLSGITTSNDVAKAFIDIINRKIKETLYSQSFEQEIASALWSGYRFKLELTILEEEIERCALSKADKRLINELVDKACRVLYAMDMVDEVPICVAAKIIRLVREAGNELNISAEVLEKFIERLLDQSARYYYLSSTYVVLAPIMFILEGFVSKFRYPEPKGWTPVRQIKEDITLTYLAKQILNHMEEMLALEILRAFIKGEIETHEKAVRIYNTIRDWIIVRAELDY